VAPLAIQQQNQSRSESNGIFVFFFQVGGFLLPPTVEFDYHYWGEGLNVPGQRIVCVHPSPIASLHDRCEKESIPFRKEAILPLPSLDLPPESLLYREDA
jgi:hypothetical protein